MTHLNMIRGSLIVIFVALLPHCLMDGAKTAKIDYFSQNLLSTSTHLGDQLNAYL